ncbi:NCS1 nucleoside transporter [Colletotrichum cuscutae]|uniref:NCS1 nucleoside transporter n=1 Tax=Colletotrichum cuscutae TaxID=1209917 RepID=A0AAI9U9L4_9PEZI|nr:NCS1 nucleoside transporter [Colletotrichum cuscutae]
MGLRKRLELRSESADLGTEGGRLSNKDMDPIPMGSTERTWGWPSLLGFWIAEAFSISMYQVSSTSVTKGLNPGLAILAVFIGHVLVCIPAMLDGYVGCIFGINFPVFTRASFGLRGWAVPAGHDLRHLAVIQQLPESPRRKRARHQLRAVMLFLVHHRSAATTLVAYRSKGNLSNLFSGKGFGPTFSKPTLIKNGTPAIVVFFQCVTSAIGPKATLALNMPDFTRYAKEPRQVFWTQAVGLCVLVTMCGVLGATVSSASEVIYGKVTWNPLEVARLWDNRAAQFFAGLCWAFAVIGTNISANSVSFSNDLALWFPKYINNRRGAYICAVFGVCAVPWYIQYSAKSFSSFLGGYSLFLGAIAGIIITDFWICRKRAIAVSSLFDPRGIHYYTFGVNPRAVIAFIFAIIPNMPGLAAACGAKGVPKEAIYLYSLSWLVSTLVTSFTYWACWKIKPFPVDNSRELLYVDGYSTVEDSNGSEKGLKGKDQDVKTG